MVICHVCAQRHRSAIDLSGLLVVCGTRVDARLYRVCDDTHDVVARNAESFLALENGLFIEGCDDLFLARYVDAF